MNYKKAQDTLKTSYKRMRRDNAEHESAIRSKAILEALKNSERIEKSLKSKENAKKALIEKFQKFGKELLELKVKLKSLNKKFNEQHFEINGNRNLLINITRNLKKFQKLLNNQNKISEQNFKCESIICKNSNIFFWNAPSKTFLKKISNKIVDLNIKRCKLIAGGAGSDYVKIEKKAHFWWFTKGVCDIYIRYGDSDAFRHMFYFYQTEIERLIKEKERIENSNEEIEKTYNSNNAQIQILEKRKEEVEKCYNELNKRINEGSTLDSIRR